MRDWLINNAWALIIAGLTLISTFALYGYRIDSVEAALQTDQASIAKLNDQNVQVQVGLAKIQTDIEYIKAILTKKTN